MLSMFIYYIKEQISKNFWEILIFYSVSVSFSLSRYEMKFDECGEKLCKLLINTKEASSHTHKIIRYEAAAVN